MTQKALANMVGISPGAISNIFNGYRRPSWRLAKRLGETFGTGPELWLEGSPDEMRQVARDFGVRMRSSNKPQFRRC